MQKTSIITLSLMTTTILFSETNIGKKEIFDLSKVKISIGLKNWQNCWQTSAGGVIGSDKNDPGFIISNNIDSSVGTIIPILNLSYKRFFLSSSYYNKTKFDFPRISFIKEKKDKEENSKIKHYTLKLSAKRKEWDITSGYSLNKNVALLLGYKKIDQTFTHQFTIDNITKYRIATSEVYGPVIGVSGHSIGNGFGVYGTYAHGFLKSKITKATEIYDTSYNLIETGLTYLIPTKKNISHIKKVILSIGYKIQTYSTNDVTPSGEDGIDTTYGLITGINLAF